MASPGAVRPSVGAALQSCLAGSAACSRNAASMMPMAARIASSTVRPVRVQTAALSTTASLLKRHKYPGARSNRDMSKRRGESAIRRTGTRWRLSVSDDPLPQPVKRAELPAIETDPDHGLWEFFADRNTVAAPPEEVAKHGRAWMVEELRAKSWDDLHRLWWVCVKERNRIATADWERNRGKLGFGKSESGERDKVVKKTMQGIKHVLTERQYAWEDAVKLAETDPEIDLSGEGPVFTPKEYLEAEDVLVESETAESTNDSTEPSKAVPSETTPLEPNPQSSTAPRL
ncbi:mitochondrial 39-S ribosomal protein L47 (MRP-L47)-domain-containing protein [Echria macrotheca]|uniref:Large ribosomal subunit protein uL29m n=1 Tax=Echria macrotheca TaxID=438768 RepID=A0AAJ0BFB7_9PEZI|nr:mitochondrial 39-S ribosomal protein L47 (MRP-L47)-domain-containing protein [Echria macrotheca]